MKALITGATGFIGSHLTEKLIKRGYDITCLVRNSFDLKWLEGLNVKLVNGDCSDKASLINCRNRYDYIFHLAGVTKTSCIKEFYTVNSKGTGNMVEWTADNNRGDLKRFVYLSTLSAAGPGHGASPVHENKEPHPVSDYGNSKLKGEEAVLKYRGTIPATIVRPCAVYGPRDREFFLIYKFVKKGIMPYWGDGKISLVYIDDLTDAIILAAEHENAVGKTYHISDGITYSHHDLINEISLALGARVFKMKLPGPVLPVIGFFGDRISKIMGKKSMINSDRLKELRHTGWVCDIEEAYHDLGYRPRVGMTKGVKWTADWYRIHKWL